MGENDTDAFVVIAAEDAERIQRCRYCIYYRTLDTGLVAYAECGIDGEIRRFDGFCEYWTYCMALLQDAPQTEPPEETDCREENMMTNIESARQNLLKRFKRLETRGVITSRSWPLIVTHKDSNFPGFKFRFSQSETIYVATKLVNSGATNFTLWNEDDVESFVDAYEVLLRLKARHRS